jgi:hypothetical protein
LKVHDLSDAFDQEGRRRRGEAIREMFDVIGGRKNHPKTPNKPQSNTGKIKEPSKWEWGDELL